MATSKDGFICDEKDETPWSDEEFNEFYKFAKKNRNLIIGRKTYEIMKKNGEIDNLNNVKIIVLSKNIKLNDKNIVSADSPKKAVELLLKNGFDNILIGGGAEINTSFMKEDLINEVILDVVPVFLGKGKRIFSDEKFENMLELIDEKQMKGFVQKMYKVKN